MRFLLLSTVPVCILYVCILLVNLKLEHIYNLDTVTRTMISNIYITVLGTCMNVH